jgi:hypothetical protein
MGGDGKGEGKSGEGKAGAGKGGAGMGMGGGEGKPNTQPEGSPAPGMGRGDPGSGGSGIGDSAPTPPGKKEKPRPSRVLMMQLRDLKKSIDADILKDAKMSKEQFEKFLRDLEGLAKRREAAEKENDVRGGDSTLPSSVGKGSAEPGGKLDDLRGTGRPKPTSEYAPAMAEIIRKAAQQPKQ